MKTFQLTRVVTKDVVTDMFQSLRNFFGFRLRGYEQVLNKHIEEMLEEMKLAHDVSWFRMIINPLTNGSAMIIIYGEEKEEILEGLE